MARKRGLKSVLPPRTSGDRRLNIPPTEGKFLGDSDFSTREIVEVLIDAGWRRPPFRVHELPPSLLVSIAGKPRKKIKLPPRYVTAGERNAVYEKFSEEDPIVEKIYWCVRDYLVARQAAVKPKEFRSELAAFERALRAFARNVPREESALAKSVDDEIERKLNSEFDELVRSRNTYIVGWSEFADFREYIERHKLKHLSAVVQMTLQVVSAIRVAESGRGKDADREAHKLIADLAGIFRKCTRKSPRRINDPTRSNNAAVAGHFGRFVKAVDKQIPTAFRLKDIDNLIRSHVNTLKRGAVD